mmetsp:Transcript_20447/g.32934  ORF Transcript_20447/g.32934 Transcript_20447/m.32934 type:complete len:819 (-) Transcript_20447:188-2644(-)
MKLSVNNLYEKNNENTSNKEYHIYTNNYSKEESNDNKRIEDFSLQYLQDFFKEKSRMDDQIDLYLRSKNIISDQSRKPTENMINKLTRRTFSFFQKKSPLHDLSNSYFYCNSIKIFGTTSNDKILDHESLKNFLSLQTKTICNKKQLFNDINMLQQLKLFKSVKFFIINKNQGSYDIIINLQKEKIGKIQKLSFVNCNILPNSLKSSIIEHFIGKDNDVINVSLIKKIVDNWYHDWDYLGSTVHGIVGIKDNNLKIVVREAYLNSLNVGFVSEYDEDDEEYEKNFQIKRFYENLLDPFVKIFHSLFNIKIGQPFNRSIKSEILKYINNLEIINSFSYYEQHMPTSDDYRYFPFLFDNNENMFIDVFYELGMCTLSSMFVRLTLGFSRLNNEMKGMSPEYYFESDWELISIKKKIQVFNLYYNKNASIYSDMYDEIEMLCELFMPYFNYSDDIHNLLNFRLILFIEDGLLSLSDLHDNHSIDNDNDTDLLLNFWEFEKDEILYSKQKTISPLAKNNYHYDEIERNKYTQNFEEFQVMCDDQSDPDEDDGDDDIYYDYDEDPFETYRLGIKMMFEEEVSDTAFVALNYLLNYTIIEDDYESYLDNTENVYNNINTINDTPPLLYNNQNIDPKLAMQFLFNYNDLQIKSWKISGFKSSYFFETGLSLNGLQQKMLFELTNYSTLYQKKIGALNGITLILHNKFGYNIGQLPFYEAFILGGSKSTRGYSDGEIGMAKNMLQMSIEIRLSINSYVDKLFNFFDYSSDLDSSKNLIYNPGDYKLFSGQGSSFGIGFFIGSGRIEYGINTLKNTPFLNLEYGEKY